MRLHENQLETTTTTTPNPGPSNPTVNIFTRRSFMKTSALTVGAVALLSQGTALAVEGAASSSIWWDMNCASPSIGEDISYASFSDPSGNNAWALRFEFKVQTNKLQDPPEAGYNSIGFTHTAILSMFEGNNDEPVLGSAIAFNYYELNCDPANGAMFSLGRQVVQSVPPQIPPCSSSVTEVEWPKDEGAPKYLIKLKVWVGTPIIEGLGLQWARFTGVFSGTIDIYGPDGFLLNSIDLPAEEIEGEIGQLTASIVNFFIGTQH